MELTAVIMAGGQGERFWPKSRQAFPKQFLSLTDDGETMLQKTIRRLLRLVKYENIFIVTNSNYVDIINVNSTDFIKKSGKKTKKDTLKKIDKIF